MVAKLIVVPLHLILQSGKLGFMLRGYSAIEYDIAGSVAVQIPPGISRFACVDHSHYLLIGSF
jgi:hypothetical protein